MSPSNKLTYFITEDTDLKNPRLTFDDFFQYASDIHVERFKSNNKPEASSILEAVRHMRKSKSDGECYCFSVSSHKTLTKLFELPKYVSERDLFTKYLNKKDASTYLKSRLKLFYGFGKGYKSSPRSAYGGMFEWFHLLSGSVTVTLAEPTQTNLLKFSSWEPEEKFIPERKTKCKHHLKPGSLLIIPPGWLSILKVDEESFAVGGEFTNEEEIPAQLDQFERNVNETLDRFQFDRDMEIRTLYCLTAPQVLETKVKNTSLVVGDKTILRLKDALIDWRKARKPLPSGINYAGLIKELTSRAKNNRSSCLKRRENSANILSDQTSAHNHTD